MLAADRHPDQVGGHVLALGLVAGAALDQRLDPAEAGRVCDQSERGADRIGALGAAADLERHHRPETAHLLRRELMAGVVGEAGIADAGDPGVLGQPPGELGSVRLRALDPQGQRAHAAQGEEDLERARDRAGQGAAVDQLAMARLVGGDDDAQQRVRVAADVLGCRVDDEVGAELERVLQQRGRQGGVDGDCGPAVVRGGGQGAQIGDSEQRVVWRLGPDQVGTVDRGQGRGEVGLVDEGDVEDAALGPFREQPTDAA